MNFRLKYYLPIKYLCSFCLQSIRTKPKDKNRGTYWAEFCPIEVLAWGLLLPLLLGGQLTADATNLYSMFPIKSTALQICTLQILHVEAGFVLLAREILLLVEYTLICDSRCTVGPVQSGEYQGLIFWGGGGGREGDQLLSFLDFAPSTAFVFPSLHSAVHSATLEKSNLSWKSRAGPGKLCSIAELRLISHLSPIDGIWEEKSRNTKRSFGYVATILPPPQTWSWPISMAETQTLSTTWK